MSLPVKITLLLSSIVILFLALQSAFLYSEINKNYRAQADQQMLLCTTLLEHRVEYLQTTLQKEMEQLAATLFTENETVVAAMLSSPPDYNTEVVRFAEHLRRRTTLHYLAIISADGVVLSTSENPAQFQTEDPFGDMPLHSAVMVSENSEPRVEWKQKATFGGRAVFLRGGYSVRKELDRVSFPGLKVTLHGNGDPAPDLSPQGQALFRKDLNLKDYHGAPLLQVIVTYPATNLLAQKRQVIQSSLLFIAASVVLFMIIGHILSLWISRPLQQLTDASLLMSVGNYDVRVPQNAGGEVGELVVAFNRMAEQLQEQTQKLIETERVAAWQEIARHLAHEIKNPLTPIRTSITNLRLALEKAPDKFPEIFLESSESVLEEVEKLRRLADEFARFARLPLPELRPGNLNELVQKNLVLYRDQPQFQIEFQPGTLPDFPFDSGQITEVLHNLMRNAMEAMPQGGKISIQTRNSDSHALLEIQDSGEGMSEEVRKQIFTPYFTTKTSGTGLGLAIVRRIVEQHGGTISVDSTPGKGTHFTIKFPFA